MLQYALWECPKLSLGTYPTDFFRTFRQIFETKVRILYKRSRRLTLHTFAYSLPRNVLSFDPIQLIKLLLITLNNAHDREKKILTCGVDFLHPIKKKSLD